MAQNDTIFSEAPQALERLGKDIFVKAPVYCSSKKFVPIYINQALFQQYIPHARPDTSWEEMSDAISGLFSITLDAEDSTKEKLGDAFIDKQFDPLKFATRGNLGSGRAYYVGKLFNIKGEKTPLCTSDDVRFSDGILDIERGIWEAIIANTLYQDVEFGVPPVLAILDIGEPYFNKKQNKDSRKVRIIRIDDNGSLERMTHIFASKPVLNGNKLRHIAKQFGKLEGEKFIHRIIHGAWSSGNITPDGDMLDFDTVCAVKGRNPTYSSSVWQAATYFGYEYMGQSQILEKIADDPVINHGKLKAETLKQDCLDAMEEQISRKLLYLAGFENVEEIYPLHKKSIVEVAQQFIELSRKFYPKKTSLYLHMGGSSLVHVLDFSTLFRAYPLLNRTKQFTVDKALQLMMETELLEKPIEQKEIPWSAEKEKDYFDKHVWEIITKDCVESLELLETIKEQATDFISAYDHLFEVITKELRPDLLKIEARAYVLNEDRLYLFPPFNPSHAIAENKAKLTAKQQNEVIESFIICNKRSPLADEFQTDTRILHEGIYSTILDGKGHHSRKIFLHKNTGTANDLINKKNVNIQIGNKAFLCTVKKTKQHVIISSKDLDNSELLPEISRDTPLLLKNIVLTDKNEYKIRDFLEG